MQNRFICLLKKEKKREGERERERKRRKMEKEREREREDGERRRMCVDANVTDFYSNANECVRPKIVGLPNR
jgi:hypothetical protein